MSSQAIALKKPSSVSGNGAGTTYGNDLLLRLIHAKKTRDLSAELREKFPRN
jgi:hypothetical protein